MCIRDRYKGDAPYAQGDTAVITQGEGEGGAGGTPSSDRYAEDPIGTDIPADEDEDEDAWSLTGR